MPRTIFDYTHCVYFTVGVGGDTGIGKVTKSIISKKVTQRDNPIRIDDLKQTSL